MAISNTSPLFYLSQVGRLDLLRDLYRSVYVPLAVQTELRKGAALGLAIPELSALPWIHIVSLRDRSLLPPIADLGAGEAEVIALGLSHPNSLLLLDDALGRRIAREKSLVYTGTLGVLIRAKKEGLLPTVTSVVEDLRRTTMYLSPELISAVLREVDEV